MPELSVIVPIFNEEANIRPLYSQSKSTLDNLGKAFEIIFVDDGSKDNSFNVLKDIAQKDGTIKVIRFNRNYGQTAALAAGFLHAQGEILITMDGDLQNDPKDIPLILNKMQQGYDIVSGWRKERKDPLLSKKIPSWIANWLISFITGVHLHDYGCTLKAYKKEVVKDLNLCGEMHRFLPALASWNGISISELAVRHHPRLYGKSKYGLSRTIKVILDLITVKFLLNFSTKPIQLFGIWGIFSLLLGSIAGVFVILMKILQNKDMTGNPLLYLTILFFFVGVQFIMMGLLGEIMSRIYHESRNHPTYRVKEII